MSPLHARWLLFLFGCIGTRTALTYLSYIASPTLLRTLGVFALIPAIGFWFIYLKGLRRTGGEVFGAPIWWDHLRPIHGTLWGIFALLAIFGWPQSWKVLAVDTLFGLGAFLIHHFT